MFAQITAIHKLFIIAEARRLLRLPDEMSNDKVVQRIQVMREGSLLDCILHSLVELNELRYEDAVSSFFQGRVCEFFSATNFANIRYERYFSNSFIRKIYALPLGSKAYCESFIRNCLKTHAMTQYIDILDCSLRDIDRKCDGTIQLNYVHNIMESEYFHELIFVTECICREIETIFSGISNNLCTQIINIVQDKFTVHMIMMNKETLFWTNQLRENDSLLSRYNEQKKENLNLFRLSKILLQNREYIMDERNSVHSKEKKGVVWYEVYNFADVAKAITKNLSLCVGVDKSFFIHAENAPSSKMLSLKDVINLYDDQQKELGVSEMRNRFKSDHNYAGYVLLVRDYVVWIQDISNKQLYKGKKATPDTHLEGTPELEYVPSLEYVQNVAMILSSDCLTAPNIEVTMSTLLTNILDAVIPEMLQSLHKMYSKYLGSDYSVSVRSNLVTALSLNQHAQDKIIQQSFSCGQDNSEEEEYIIQL